MCCLLTSHIMNDMLHTGQLDDVKHQRIGNFVQEARACSFGLHSRNITRPPNSMDEPKQKMNQKLYKYI